MPSYSPHTASQGSFVSSVIASHLNHWHYKFPITYWPLWRYSLMKASLHESCVCTTQLHMQRTSFTISQYHGMMSSKPVDPKRSATSSQGNCTPDHNYVTVWCHIAQTEVVECTDQWHNLYFVMLVSGQFLIYSCLAELQNIKTSNTPQITDIWRDHEYTYVLCMKKSEITKHFDSLKFWECETNKLSRNTIIVHN